MDLDVVIMLADFVELESYGWSTSGIIRVDVHKLWKEAFVIEAVNVLSATVNLAFLWAGITQHVLFPGNAWSSILSEEVTVILWVMIDAKVLVGLSESLWRKAFDIGLVFTVHSASTPTGVNEFPLPVVNLNCVPGMA
jgi:hypothetical protein